MFNSARLKLTLWYLLIIMSVSAMFSLTIYNIAGQEIERFARAQRFRVDRMTPIDPDLITESKNRFGLFLLTINGVILIVSASLGYFLAGRTLRPIQDMMEDQNRFISDASHELRTPLTALKAAFEVHLRDKKSTLSQANLLIEESLEDVNKLQTLSESLLHLARFEQTGDRSNFQVLALKPILQKAIRTISPLAKQKKIQIDSEIADGKILGYDENIYDLLVIILDNAVKYSPENSQITIKQQLSDGHILITISDQGVGISAIDLPHIFDRFYRGDLSRSANDKKGYGLGLSIAKKIVDLHSGEITVKSKVNTGTTFQLKFSKA